MSDAQVGAHEPADCGREHPQLDCRCAACAAARVERNRRKAGRQESFGLYRRYKHRKDH